MVEWYAIKLVYILLGCLFLYNVQVFKASIRDFIKLELSTQVQPSRDVERKIKIINWSALISSNLLGFFCCCNLDFVKKPILITYYLVGFPLCKTGESQPTDNIGQEAFSAVFLQQTISKMSVPSCQTNIPIGFTAQTFKMSKILHKHDFRGKIINAKKGVHLKNVNFQMTL